PPCPKRRANSNLPLAGSSPSEQHVGDVGASNQQNEADRAQQHKQAWPQSPYSVFSYGDQPDAIVRVSCRVLPFDASGYRVHLGLSLLQRPAWPEPSNRPQVPCAPLLVVVFLGYRAVEFGAIVDKARR